MIHKMVIPGIVMIGVAVGATILSGERKEPVANQQIIDSQLAATILSQAVDIRKAAIAGLEGGISQNEIIAKPSVLGEYGLPELPTPPTEAGNVSGYPLSWALKASYAVKNAASQPADIGSMANEGVLILDRLSMGVCLKINEKLYGENPNKSSDDEIGPREGLNILHAPNIQDVEYKESASEGCVPGVSASSGYTYFKAIFIN